MRFEQLEGRILLAADWQNSHFPEDVNNDASVSPIDVLLIINELNSRTISNSSGSLPPPGELGPPPFIDTNADSIVSPVDVLLVVNYLNAGSDPQGGLAEQTLFDSYREINIPIGQDEGARIYRMQVGASFGASNSDSLLPDLFSVYLVDAGNPSTTLLDRGVNGSSLFSLSARGAEMATGLVRWDGSILEIDLSSVEGRNTGLLRMQLLNGDPSSSSRVIIRPLENEIDSDRVAGELLASGDIVFAPGSALNTGALSPTNSVGASVGNIRYDSLTRQFIAEARIANLGDAVGRDMALVIAGLPAGVTLANASGVDGQGRPYINMRDAIRTGGLRRGERSERVELRINNPSRVPLHLQPLILVGEANRAPTIAPLADQSVHPGGRVEIQIEATDADGDRLTYSFRSADGSAIPSGRLDAGSGLLTFAPTPQQLGSYLIEVIASDGVLDARRTMTLDVIADSLTTTRISGFVLDVDQSPLPGMVVELGSVQGLTQGDGSFTLELGAGPLVSDTLKIRGELFPGPRVYPFIAEKLPLLLEHDVYASVNNVIGRPIFLPPLDVANGRPINPMQNTLVTTAALPGASVLVAAGTLMDQQGTPFDGVLSITEVPGEFTPAALPDNLIPDLVVTIQPGEMVFAAPAPLSLPNPGYAPGVEMDLWSINPVTGDFDNVGTGRVSSDGKMIQTISGGIRNSSWHFFSNKPVVSQAPQKNPSNTAQVGTTVKSTTCPLPPPPPPVEANFGCSVEFHSGTILETHDLVTYESLGQTRGVMLTYDSLRADPRPIIHVGYEDVDPAIYSVPSALRLVAKLSVERGGFSQQVPGNSGGQLNLTGGENFWRLPTSRGPLDAALQADLRAQPSGRYDYTLMSGILGFAASANGYIGSSTAQAGSLLHVNSVGNPFGNGWGLAGLQQIIENPDGSLLLIDGDGDEDVFEAPATSGGPYVSSPGDFSTMVRQPDGTFRRTLKDQTVYTFNAKNNLETVVDRYGNTTRYSYDDSDRLTTISDPVGLQTTFVHTDGRVTAITDPANRTTRLSYDADGNLVQITDPDNSTRIWEYDSDHHMTGETDQRGHREQTFYDSFGRATRVIRKDGSESQIKPVQVRGLYPVEQTRDPNTAPAASTTNQAEAVYLDGNGNATRNSLDSAGQHLSSRDAVGSMPTVVRDDRNLIIESLDARKNRTTFSYDDRGNLLNDTVVLDPGDTALEFDGINDEVRIGDRLDMGTSDFTLEAWIKGDPTMEDWGRILDKGFATGYSLHRVANTRKVGFEFLASGSFFGTNSDLIDNTWHHVAVVKAGTTVRIYADGNEENTETVSAASQNGQLPLLIGWNPGEGTRGHWKGELDEIRIWTVARSEADIRATMFQPLAGNEVGLAAYYRFKAEPTETVPDQTANDNDGILGGGVPDNQPVYVPSTSPFILGAAPTDKALSFDGFNDEVRIGDRLDMGTSDFTLEAWIKGDPTMGAWSRILDKGFATGYSMHRIGASNKVGFTFFDQFSQHTLFGTTSDVIDRTWHHVAVVKQGTTVRIYADGREENSDTVTSQSQDNSLPLLIGWNPGEGGSDHWKGQLDEIRIWTRARTQAEIQTDINRTLNGDESGLAAYYRFDEGTGDIAIDQTGNGNDGNLGSGDAAKRPAYVFSTLPFLAVQPAPALTATRNYAFEPAFNQLTSMTDEVGRQTLMEIDPANGNTLSVTRVVGAVGGADDVVTRMTYTAQGLLATMTDPNGHVTRYDYDASGRMITVTEAAGTPDEGIMRYEYDAAGNVAATMDENGNRTVYEYDALNRVVRVTEADPDGAGSLASPVTQFVYDLAGNLVMQTDALNHATQFAYDSRNRLTSTTDAQGGISRRTFDLAGNIISAVDELGHETTYVYDPRNRLVETIDPDGGHTQFGYDLDDNPASLIDPVGNVTQFAYDVRNQLVLETDPLGATSLFTYDAASQLIARRDRNGRIMQFEYDDLSRLKTETWVGAGNVVDYAYDPDSNLLSIADDFSSLAFAYDARDRVKTVDNNGTPGAPRVELTYQYDAVGRVTSVEDRINGSPGGLNSYSYDGLNRLIQLTQSGAGVAPKRVNLAYNPLGQFAALERYSDLAGTQIVASSTFAYDTLNRLTALSHAKAAGPVSFFNFTYDAADRITRIIDVDGASDYTFDDRDQLIRADHSLATNPDETYGFDANGNRTTSHGHGSAYQTGPSNRLRSDGTFNYAYDDEGNLILRTEIATSNIRELQYDHLNRLVAVLDKDATGVLVRRTDYSYDAFNRRIYRSVDNSPGDAVAPPVDHFVYDRDDVLLEFLDPDGSGPQPATLNSRLLHGPAVDQVLAQDDGAGGVQWHLTDHLGTVRDLVDNSGSVVNHFVYDSFGNVISEISAGPSSRYLFTGREFDPSVNLYYYRARYYDAALARFLSEDPIRYTAGDANLYRYVGNSPLSAIDPWGLDKVRVIRVEGEVEVSPGGDDSQAYILRPGDIINESDRIVTAMDSQAVLEFPDGTVATVKELEDFKVASYQDAGTLIAARLWKRGLLITACVNQVSERPSDFKFKTPTPTAGVRA